MSYPSDYETRRAEFSFSTPDAIREALTHKNTILLDLRSATEIESVGRVDQFDTTNKVLNTPCAASPPTYPELSTDPEKFLGEGSKDALIVIYCGSGRRAFHAKKILQEKGYDESRLLNAGGFNDIKVTLGV